MRIACFSDTFIPELNGVASSIDTLVKQLRKNGHVVYVVTTKPNSMDYKEDPFVIRLEGIELKQLYGYTLTTPVHLKVYKQIKDLDLDVIHCHTEFGVGMLAHYCAANLHIPLVSTYHTTYEDYTHYVNVVNSKTIDIAAKKIVSIASKQFLKKSMAIIAPSEKTKTMLINYGCNAPIYIIPTGLDLNRFSPGNVDKQKVEDFRNEYDLNNYKTIVFVGRIAQEKSLDVVINCFKALCDKYNNYKLLIVGKGPSVDDINDLIEQYHLKDRIIYVGPKDREEIPVVYNACDLFVSASLTETQGVTFIESLASGTPILARKDEVLDGLLLDKETGYFFGDEDSFVQAIDQYETLDSEQLSAMKNKCIEVTEPYNQEIFYEKIIEVYQKAIDDFLESYILVSSETKQDCIILHFINANQNDVTVLTSLDNYMDKGFRKGCTYSILEVEELLEQEPVVKQYLSMVKYCLLKDRTVKEIYDYLTVKTNLNISQINQIVSLLQEKGYLDDQKYAVNAIYSMQAKLFGVERIKKELKKHGVSIELINQYLNDDEDQQFESALHYARIIKFNENNKLSVKGKQKKLYNKLISQGYSNDVALKVINNIDFSFDLAIQADVCVKVAEKGIKLYEKRYNGSALRNKVFNYCLNQGFDYSDIYAAIDTLDWSKYNE